MSKAIIGHTGFVGGNIINQFNFDYKFNTSNISDIKGQSFNLLVIAAPSAEKWKANQDPENDLNKIQKLIDVISTVKATQVVLISTVDVYKNPNNVDEDSIIETEQNHAYGRNRFYFEEFIRDNFQNHLIIRLPGLFGKGLKKNFIFDMLNNNKSEFTDKDSIFQFYCLDNIWKDIEIALQNSISLINFATEPVSVSEVAKECFNIEFKNETKNNPISYKMQTKFASIYGKNDKYIYEKKEIINQLKNFIKNYEL